MKALNCIFAVTVLFFCGPLPLQAKEYTVSIQEKQQDKYTNRWTLSDWFETQRKMRLQDMWLAGVTNQSPFEFFVGYDSAVLKLDPSGPSTRVNRGYLSAYAYLVGLEGHYVKDKVAGEGWDGLFNFRILGDSVQNTNIILSYGVRNREISPETFQNNFYQGSLSLYFTKSFGIDGHYRKIVKAEGSKKTELEGSEAEYTAFIDFSFFRPYVSYQNEVLYTVDPTSLVKTETRRNGYFVGLKLFF